MCLKNRGGDAKTQLPQQLKSPEPSSAAAPSVQSTAPATETILGLSVGNTSIPEDAVKSRKVGHVVGYKIVQKDGALLVSQFQDFVWKSGELLATGKGSHDGKGFYVMLKKPDPLWAQKFMGSKKIAILPVQFKPEDVVAAGEDGNAGVGYCAIVKRIFVNPADYKTALSGESLRKDLAAAKKLAQANIAKAKKEAAVAAKAEKDAAKASRKSASAVVRSAKKRAVSK